MSQAPAYSSWHPRRLPDRPIKRQDSYDSTKLFSSRPATPIFGQNIAEPTPQVRRVHSDASLLQFQLEPTLEAQRRGGRTLHQRVRSISQRIPLPQGISLAVGACTAVAFILSVTTLAIGMANRRMLQDATEQRHDPHSALMRMIYTVVLEAMRTAANNQTGTVHVPPTILPPP